MRIGEIASSAEYQMDEQFQNLPIFGAKFGFFKLNNWIRVRIIEVSIQTKRFNRNESSFYHPNPRTKFSVGLNIWFG